MNNKRHYSKTTNNKFINYKIKYKICKEVNNNFKIRNNIIIFKK